MINYKLLKNVSSRWDLLFSQGEKEGFREQGHEHCVSINGAEYLALFSDYFSSRTPLHGNGK
jgi:hypothetical protein